MRKDLLTSVAALLGLTVLFGLAYPLAITAFAQVVAPGKANGSLIERDGKPIGSKLIGRDFTKAKGAFQGRPSATGYAADATYFNNLGPNSKELSKMLADNVRTYLRREGRDTPGLSAADVPPDAVMTSGSGIDPQISPENAAIQARRVARERGLALREVQRLVKQHTDGRVVGLIGDPRVNVLELNLAVDTAAARR